MKDQGQGRKLYLDFTQIFSSLSWHPGSHFYLNQAVLIFSTCTITFHDSLNRGFDHPRKYSTYLCREEWCKTPYIAGENNKMTNSRSDDACPIFSIHENSGLLSFAFLGFFDESLQDFVRDLNKTLMLFRSTSYWLLALSQEGQISLGKQYTFNLEVPHKDYREKQTPNHPLVCSLTLPTMSMSSKLEHSKRGLLCKVLLPSTMQGKSNYPQQRNTRSKTMQHYWSGIWQEEPSPSCPTAIPITAHNIRMPPCGFGSVPDITLMLSYTSNHISRGQKSHE